MLGPMVIGLMYYTIYKTVEWLWTGWKNSFAYESERQRPLKPSTKQILDWEARWKRPWSSKPNLFVESYIMVFMSSMCLTKIYMLFQLDGLVALALLLLYGFSTWEKR